MPEGDTIYRAAATLNRALAGRSVVRFESVFPALTRVHDDHPLTAMTIDRVESAGKHLLMHFSGGLVLRTHMRMHGSWHIYRPGERWRQRARDMRVLVATADFEAVGFNIPVAEFIKIDAKRDLAKHAGLSKLGPTRSTRTSIATRRCGACARGRRRPSPTPFSTSGCIAGLGNVFKSEVLFSCGDQPVRHRRGARRSPARASRRHRPEAAAGQRQDARRQA